MHDAHRVAITVCTTLPDSRLTPFCIAPREYVLTVFKGGYWEK